LPDRYVEGLCPHCKKPAKGDSCDHCGKILEPEELLNAKCILCGGTPVPKRQTQMYIKMSALQDKIQNFFDARKENWPNNAVGMTQRYLDEGLRDRAITRSIPWGIDIPRDGWDDRKIYIWAENVLGYLSASETEFIAEQKNTVHYYVHGKDNIPFHSIILPALILSRNSAMPKSPYHLPDYIISSEYINVNGEKISKSRGNQIFAETMYENFDIDVVRFYLLRIINDKRDANFTCEEFTNVVNGELVNNFGNLVNRTLSFVKTKFENKIPKITRADDEVTGQIILAKGQWYKFLENGQVSNALKIALDLVNFGNKYFADKKPWAVLENDGAECKNIIATVIEIIRTATELLNPFIPFSCEKVAKWLEHEILPEIGVLWQRLDLKAVKDIIKL
jgi:methionyl-tRNA synthetase